MSRNIWVRLIAVTSFLFALLGSTLNAHAAVVTFTGDSISGPITPLSAESAWLTAVGAPASTEGFEGGTVTNGSWPLSTYAGTGIQVSGIATSFGVWNDPFSGDHAADGTKWLQTFGGAGTRALKFDGFAAPIQHFGLWITDYEVAGAMTLSINGAAAQSLTILATGAGRETGNETFFGIVAGDGEAFSELTLAWTQDYIGVDKIMFGQQQPVDVPEPGTLVFVGLAGLLLLRQRRAPIATSVV